jgi:nitrogen fixation NifU-like protein
VNQDIYQQHILEHAKHPKNKQQMEYPDVEHVAKNVSCGDSYILYLQINAGIITNATFTGVGCAISTAAGSLLTEAIRGMSVNDAKKFSKSDMNDLLKVTISAGREKCAYLLSESLQEAIKSVK